MRFWLPILGLMLASSLEATAQVSVEVTLDQEQFLPSEAVPAAVRITNRSGQPLHLGAEANWLTFSVQSADGFVVVKNADPSVVGEFDLGSSQVATRRVDLAPYFTLTREGHYRVTATVRLKEWGVEVASQPKGFDVVRGAKLWSQVFGVPAPAGATNHMPEVREYALLQANYLRSQLRLYVQVSDESDVRIFKVSAIGSLVSFSQPEAQLDRSSHLHVLWQSGASAFTYAIVNPSGDVVRHEIYDYYNTRPRLRADDNGNIGVIGGVRRVMPEELPVVKSPKELGAVPRP